MLLVVDIGNTNINLGFFKDEVLKKTYKIISDKNLDEKEYEKIFLDLFKNYEIQKCIICSVVEELNFIIKKTCDNMFKLNSLLLTTKSDYGMNILLKNPDTVGLDRIVNASIVKKDYKLPAIIVDIGTATTIDVISKEGNFIGGAILPGINLQFKALNLHTSKLPKIEERFSNQAIGNSTQEALLSGVIRGSACAIEGLIRQFEIELNEKVTVIMTGGDSDIIVKYLSRKIDFLSPNLTLEALRYLDGLNRREF